MKERACACFLILGSLSAIQASQMCQSSLFPTDCGFLYSGGIYRNIMIGIDTSLTGINNAGEIVGNYTESPGASEKAFLYSNGTFTTISSSTPESFAGGINDSGEVLLNVIGGPEYIYHSGVLTPIDVPGPGLGINDSGQIVGFYYDAHNETHGYLDSGGTITTIDFPGSTFTQLYGINNAGQIVGNGSVGGFLYESGHFTSIQVPGAGAASTSANGINDSGQIVGRYFANGVFRGFLDDNGVFTTRIGNLPNSPYCIATSINDAGQIVGECQNASVSATPEPASVALFGSGLAVFVALLWRSNKVARSCFRPAL